LAQTRERWPQTMRRAAVRMREAEELTAAQIAQRLSAEHGRDVPVSTVGGWLAPHRAAAQPPADLGQAIRSQAARLLALANRELTRLERGTGAIDLERLERLARTLKTVEGLKPATAATQKPEAVRSLLDLGGSSKDRETGDVPTLPSDGGNEDQGSEAF
jgi:transcriptional regulator with XRE-family HTH domain